MNRDIHEAVRLVDAFMDDDYHTRDSCPGTVNNHNLLHIANQMDRRSWWRRARRRVKNLIYIEEGTSNIWYKTSKCNVGVVAMGFSLRRLGMHPNAISMEQYTKYFIDESDLAWLERNDYILVK